MKNLNLKVTALVLFAATAVTSQAFAGAANTLVKCKNAAGKVVLEGDVPGDLAEFNLKAALRDERGQALSAELFSRTNQATSRTEENGRLTIFQDLKNGVYAFQADALKSENAQIISLYAIPKTVKVKSTGGFTASKFKAKLEIRKAQQWAQADVTCTTDYEL